MITQSELLERLNRHRVLGSVPLEEQAWIAAHGRLRRLAVGDHLASPANPIEELYIILSGRVSMFLDRPSGPRKVTEWVPGDVTGLVPYSRLSTSPGTGRADEPTDVLAVHRDDFPEMIRKCPALTEKLVQAMLDRTRLFARTDLQDEKMMSLGRMSAGLAHELDNPASAVVRGAKLLESLLVEIERAAWTLASTGISREAFAALETARDQCLSTQIQQIRSPLEQARREEELTDWLEDRGLDDEDVEALADSPITTAMMEAIASNVDEQALQAALRWVAMGCTARNIAGEIAESALRISELVRAVKGFTHMDGGTAPRLLNVGEGLTQTLAVLRAKARSRMVRVTLSIEPDLPQILANRGELNQVWANLIDNALDAVTEGGEVEVSAARHANEVVVRVVDNGHGVPAELREKIFEPFFTTKQVGEGTGLGLDIVRRLVINQDGTIELESVPGRTEFRVKLPIPVAAPAPSERLPDEEVIAE